MNRIVDLECNYCGAKFPYEDCLTGEDDIPYCCPICYDTSLKEIKNAGTMDVFGYNYTEGEPKKGRRS